MQPLVAVPAFMFAEVFSQFLPLCTGFAAGCMIWIVFGEVMPEAIKVRTLCGMLAVDPGES